MCGDKSVGSAKALVQIENDLTRVTRWQFTNRGDNTGWHRHEYDYVIVPLFDGILEIENADGNRTKAQMKNGEPYFREKGVEHDVINGNDFECAFVEVEFMDRGKTQ